MTAIGARVNGQVGHVITRENNVTACGRMVVKNHGLSLRMCKTCVRINADARRINDADRKAQREMAFRKDVTIMEMPQSSDLSWEYSLNWEELQATISKIEKINARCAKRGIPGGLNVEWEEVVKKEKNSLGIEVEWTEYSTKITGVAPSLPGWEFVATIANDEYAGIVVHAYPGTSPIDRELIRGGWCDHCQTNRFRRDTYVMRNKETGEQIQVGSSCIKDFTGWTALPVTFDRMAKDMEEMEGGFGGGGRDFTPRTILAVSWACIQRNGYVAKSAYQGQPTANLVSDVLYPPKPNSRNADYRAELQDLARYADEMNDKADELLAWIASAEFSGNSDYVLNVKAIAAGPRVSSRNMGYLVSAPQAWARYMERTLIRKQEASEDVSQWQGEIDKPLTITATIEAIRFLESDYGVTTLYKLRDEAGNLYEWFASRGTLGEYEGTVWTFTATVKAHKDWRGHKTTQLTRVRKAERQS